VIPGQVLRQSADLLIEFAAPLEPLEHWLRLAGNATVRVSFPYASQVGFHEASRYHQNIKIGFSSWILSWNDIHRLYIIYI
jgi:hypothetical protein